MHSRRALRSPGRNLTIAFVLGALPLVAGVAGAEGLNEKHVVARLRRAGWTRREVGDRS